MNRQRRKRLLQAFNKVCEVIDILEEVEDDEREAYDNLPVNFQCGERGEEMENYIEMIAEAIGCLENANSVIEQI